MAKARMLHKKISISLQVNSLPLPAKLLFTWLIAHTDDEGRILGSPKYIKATVVPMTNWSTILIQNYLKQMCSIGLINYWQENNEWYIEFAKWEDYQSIRSDRYEPSKLPSFTKENDNHLTTKRQPNDNQTTPQDNVSKSNVIEIKKSEYKEKIADKYPDKRKTTDLNSDVIEDPNSYPIKSAGDAAAKTAWEKLEPNNTRAFYSTYLNASRKGVPPSYIIQFISEIKQSKAKSPGAVFNTKVKNFLNKRGLLS